MVVLRNVTTSTLSTLPSQAGRLIFDTDTLTLKYNTGVVDQELVTTKFSGPVGINTTMPDRVLELNADNGQTLRLTYDSPGANDLYYADLDVDSAGNLLLSPTGGNINVIGASLKLPAANGTTVGLVLGSTLVTSSGTELNYVSGVTPGTALASHALVIDASKNLTGLNDLTANQVNATVGNITTLNATDIYGTIGTAAQPNITSVGTLTNLAVSGTFTINGTPLSVNSTELNYLQGVTPGTAIASKALVTDSNNNLVGLNGLASSTLVASTSITTPSLNVTNLLDLTISDNVGNTTLYPLVMTRETTATPAVGLGVGMSYDIENSSNVNKLFGKTSVRAANVTDGEETGLYSVGLSVNGTFVNDLLTLDSTGTITAFQLVESSDERIKENIVDVDSSDSLSKILSIRVRDFTFKKDEDHVVHRGVIAQELKQVIPAAVYEHEKDEFIDFHSIKCQSIVFHLVSTVQQLHKEIEELKKK